ncbi:MAG: secondary thiamine-phosphate synthase enzyme YjbQ [Pseudomonadota bacterium]
MEIRETATKTTTLSQQIARLSMRTSPRQFHDFTRELAGWLRNISAGDGLLTVFVRHTSASLTIQENADPDVQRDLLDALDGIAPENAGYRHSTEGPDDMPAHIKAMVTSTNLSIPVLGGSMDLGTWQGVYLIEHRATPHERSVALVYQGSTD